MNRAQERQKAVDNTLQQVQQRLSESGLSRQVLSAVLDDLKTLAVQPSLWCDNDFPPPADGERQARYLIGQQDDETISLYLNVMKPGKEIAPHNHTTWACIAGVEGEELNTVYQRLDDGSKEGYAELSSDYDLIIGPGAGIALMPEDIHSVLIEGERPIRHLHLYGLALEKLTDRISFDLDNKSYKKMDVGVKTRKREALENNDITPSLLKDVLANKAAEVAFLDVREFGEYGNEHPFHAVSIPYSRLERTIGCLVPRYKAFIVLMDNEDEGRARKGAESLKKMGYSNVQVLKGGIQAWKKNGYNVFAGVNVVSKTFGELVHEIYHTPSISSATISKWQAEGKKFHIFDGRPISEYNKMNIPGSICCPNGELVKRLPTLLNGDTKTPVVINCAGRTRSIIGAQTLDWVGIENPVFALENGTQGWRLAGLALDHGSEHYYPEQAEITQEAVFNAQALARKHNVSGVDAETVNQWLANNDRTTYVFDVRTQEEYLNGTLLGAIHAPGGQLIQSTDHWIGSYRSRVVLIDDDACRAPVVATWLSLLGLDVTWLKGGDTQWENIKGLAERQLAFSHPAMSLNIVTIEEALLPSVLCLDARQSIQFRQAHLPGSTWINRSLLDEQLNNIDRNQQIVIVADEEVAACLAPDLHKLGFLNLSWLPAEIENWQESGIALKSTPEQPADSACIDFLFFVHDRHDGNLEASRRYLEWETGLLAQLDAEERGTFSF